MRHAIRIAIIWLVVSILVELAITVVPIPAPATSVEGQGAHQTIYMLFYLGAPIFVFVWVVGLYGLITYRNRPDMTNEPMVMPTGNSILLLWAGISFLIVLFMAGWGTFTLHEVTQAPSVAQAQGRHVSTRQTPNKHSKSTKGTVHSGPIKAQSKVLNVQVIGQQWFWTFRYPSYGGMETKTLVLPVGVPILFHITSLDVVHSFWIYNEDVKEDAVPGVENTAWMLSKVPLKSTVNGHNLAYCNELCGLWHGYMNAQMNVTNPTAFKAWASHMESSERSSGLLKNLPAYAPIYYPSSNANWPPAPQDQSP
jgi:cytochrome c oxidase subunit 2